MPQGIHILALIILAGILIAMVVGVALLRAGGGDDLTPIGVFRVRGRGGIAAAGAVCPVGSIGRTAVAGIFIGSFSGFGRYGSGGAGHNVARNRNILIPRMGRHSGQGRAGILGNVTVGADVSKQRIHGLLSQVDTITAQHIAAFGIASGAVLQHLGAVQELPAVILAHLHQGFVVFIYLGLGQVLVGMLLAQRRNSVHNDIHTGVSILHSLDALGVIAGKAGSAVAGA